MWISDVAQGHGEVAAVVVVLGVCHSWIGWFLETFLGN